MKLKRSIFAALSSVSIATATFAIQATTRSSQDSDALLRELADRGLTTMLERAFERFDTPDEKRDAIRAAAALGRLARGEDQLSLAERREVVDRVVRGMPSIVPSLRDPAEVIRQADVLIVSGVKLDVNTLEYWGPSTTTQAQLLPVVQAVIQMLEKAAALANEQLERLAATASAADQKKVAEIANLEAISQYAMQTRAMADYYLALCLDPSDSRRADAARRGIAFLADYDFEENPALQNLKIVLGKLHAAAGDFDSARAALDEAIKLDSASVQDEKQKLALAFEARYFRAVVEVQASQPDAAQTQFDALREWETSVGLNDESIATANLLLEHRIHRARGTEADLQQASALLMKLLESRPELESQVMTQLRATITSDTPLNRLEPLLLRSLVSDAQEQVVRAQQDPNFKPEERVLQRGLNAANELMTRAGTPGASDELIENAGFLVPVFLEALGQRVEAASGFLMFAEAHRDRVELAKSALSNAQRLFAQLGGLNSENPAVTALYDRIVPLSIGEPFNQVELSFDWAYRLQQVGRAAEAIPFFRRVAASDRRYDASRYYLMVALSQRLESLPVENAERPTICREILSLADEVRQKSVTQLAKADVTNQSILRQRAARTVILAADIARTELKDPQRALDLLADVESLLVGVPDANQLLGEAMFTRIQANMQAGRSEQAVQGLVELLNKSGGEQGATIVFNMLAKLEADFAAAESLGDRQRMAKLQQDRAALTPYLVKWSENNARAEVAKFAYSYRVYDAETQRLAAEFENDPAKRAAKLAESLALFESLDTPQGREQHRNSQSSPNRLGYDPQVALGIARIRFSSGDWLGARDAYAKLLSDRALGTAITTVTDAGLEKQIDNDVYWEATARLIRSRLNADAASSTGGSNASAKEGLESLRVLLKEQEIRWGDQVGGRKWKAEFAALRAELLGEPSSSRPADR